MLETERRKSSPFASRMYPGAPSWVRLLGVASVVIGLDAAGRAAVVLNFDMETGPFLCVGGARVQSSCPRSRSATDAKCSIQLSYRPNTSAGQDSNLRPLDPKSK